MHPSRQASRAFPQLKLKLVREVLGTAQSCWARDIRSEGLFAAGAQALREGEMVHLELNPRGYGSLHLNARVVALTADGAVCQFEGNSPASLEVLGALLTPTWDGDNLLDGVLKFAPWGPSDDLASWMRLTSLVSDWHRLTRKPATS